MSLLEGIGSVLSLIVLLVWIWRVAQGCRRLLGPRFAVLGALIFVPLAVGADGAVYVLFKATQGPHAESAAYGALAALLVLFAVGCVDIYATQMTAAHRQMNDAKRDASLS